MEYKQSKIQSTMNPSGTPSEMIRILLIEDNPGDVQLVQEMLNEAEGTSFKLEWADRLSEGLKLLTREKFDLILLDLSLPDGQGLEMLEKVQACVPTTSVVLLTGTFEEEPIAIKALQSGAEDYLYKGNIDGKLLVRSVRYAIERKRVEEKLRNSQERYRALYDDNPSMYFTINAEGKVLYVNRFGAEQLGYTPNELIGQPVIDVFYEEDKKAVLGQFATCLKGPKQAFRWEFRKVRKDGTVLWVKESARAVRDIDGNIVVLIACEDITDRKLAEEALRQARNELEIRVEERTRELAKANEALRAEIIERERAEEALRQSFVQLAKKNRYESIVSTVTRSVHRSINLQDVLENAVESMKQNIEGMDYVGIFLVEGKEAALKAYRGYPDWFIERLRRIPYPRGFTWRVIMEGKPLYCADAEEDEIIGPAGREVGTKGYAAMPIRFKRKTVGVITINSLKKNAFDEEELKLLEIVAQQIETAINNAKQAEEIRKLNEELEKRVAERTVQLEAANKELEAFSYSVSHDLRAPLRAIEGFSSILLEECSSHLDAEGQRFLNIIRTNVKQMSQLIDDLLAFSRLNRQEIKLSEVKMEKLVKEVLEELKSNVSERNVEFSIKALPNSYGDRAMIRQVFVNLLSNAIKFTRLKEKAVIEVGSWIEDQQNVYYVKDNGVGFDMRYINKLFGVFQRLHTAEEFEGTGVGLAIVQRVIHRHSGQVWAEGKVGEGAMFCFTLPEVIISEKLKTESQELAIT